MIANRNPQPPRAAERAKREQSEIERSARAAANTTALRHHVSQIVRYIDPPADTAYPLEYAYHILGDVRGKTVLDFRCGWGENTLLLLHRHARVIALDISAALGNLLLSRTLTHNNTQKVTAASVLQHLCGQFSSVESRSSETLAARPCGHNFLTVFESI